MSFFTLPSTPTGKKSLMKWKGAVLISDEDETPCSNVHSSSSMDLDDGISPSLSGETVTGTVPSDTPDSSVAATLGTSTTTPTTERELDFNGGGVDSEGNKVRIMDRWGKLGDDIDGFFLFRLIDFHRRTEQGME